MAKNFIISKNLISSHFKELILSIERYVVSFGGRGGGKTKHLYLKFIAESFKTKHFCLLYVNKEFRNIRDQQYLGFKNTIKELGLQDAFKFYDGDYRIQNVVTGNWFIPKGMDNAEKTKGIEDVTSIWIDEANKCTLEDITTLDKLLRTPKADKFQLIVSFNPVSEKHWLRKYFFSESDPYKAKENFKSILIHHSTYLDNDFIDKEAYRETLLNSSNGDPARLECDLYGRWGNIRKDNLFIFNYKAERHLDLNIKENPNEFIWLSFDFNINPMTCLVFQTDLWNRFIYCIREYRINDSDVYQLCERIKVDYKESRRLLVTGDSSGWARHVSNRGHKNNFQIISEELNIPISNIKTPRGKPSNYIADKRSNANAILSRHPNFKIGNCPYLIEDIENVQAGDDNKMLKSSDASKSHLLDCFTDFLFAHCKDWHKTVKV